MTKFHFICLYTETGNTQKGKKASLASQKRRREKRERKGERNLRGIPKSLNFRFLGKVITFREIMH